MKVQAKLDKIKEYDAQLSDLYATKIELNKEIKERYENDEIILNTLVNLETEYKLELAKVNADLTTKQEKYYPALKTKNPTIPGAINELKIQTDLQNLKFNQFEDDINDIQINYFKRKEAEKQLATKQNCIEDKLRTSSNIIYEAINELKIITDGHISNINQHETIINQNIKDIITLQTSISNTSDILDLKQDKTDKTLQTKNKAVVKAINEVNTNKINIENFASFQESIIQYQTITNHSLNNKQNTNDAALTTNSKNIIKAINELKANIPTWTHVGISKSARIWNYNLVINKKYRVSYNWNTNDTTTKNYREFIWTGNNNSIETYTDGLTWITILGITVVRNVNIIKIIASNTGIQIINKIGTSSAGTIISLEELD